MNDLNEDQKKAFKAFKKRVKMHQLDDDSRLGHSPLTGAKNKIVAIQPPGGFGHAVWEELADKGYLSGTAAAFMRWSREMTPDIDPPQCRRVIDV